MDVFHTYAAVIPWNIFLKTYFSVLLLFFAVVTDIVGDWCSQDTGWLTINNGKGRPFNVYVSANRDGSIWIRIGLDHKSQDWTFHHENGGFAQAVMLSPENIDMMETLKGITDVCVLTDLQLEIHSQHAWQQSYILVYNHVNCTDRYMYLQDAPLSCRTNTTISLLPNGQSFTCTGGPDHSCGFRGNPAKDSVSKQYLVRELKMDPAGDKSWVCPDDPVANNSFTLLGSYYHVYLKVAQCEPPGDSRIFGHEPKLRPLEDTGSNIIIIPDPLQTALADGVVIAWRVFAKVVSVEHKVYLQIWRPSQDGHNYYTIVGSTQFLAEELRFQKVNLDPSNYIRIRKGDVIGIYYPQKNPLAWSSVPCAYTEQRHLYIESPNRWDVGATLQFHRAAPSRLACRHYSVQVVLANKTSAKVIQDWICPDTSRGKSLKTEAIFHNDDRTNSGKRNNNQNNYYQKPSHTIDSIPVHLILIIIGSLILLLTIIGFISYYRAIKS